MEADGKSENGSDFERVETNEEQLVDEEKQQQDILLGAESSFNIGTELGKMYDKLQALSAENDQIRADNEAMKTDNKLLAEKNNTLVAKLGEMQAKLETMEQKLKVAELEAKLAKQEMSNLIVENVNEAIGQLRDGIPNKTRTKNDALSTKVDLLQSQNGELQTKLEVIELEMKFISEKLVKMVEEKLQDNQQKHDDQQEADEDKYEMKAALEGMGKQLGETSVELRDKMAALKNQIQQKYGSRLESMGSKMMEGNAKLEKELREAMKQKFDVQAYKDKQMKAELEKKVEQLDQRIVVFGGKIFDLAIQAKDGQNKLDGFAEKLDDLEAKDNESRVEMELWKNNRWDSTGHVQLMDVKKSNWTNIRALKPISSTVLASIPGRLVYYEVLLRNDPSMTYIFTIGWAGPDFPLKQSWVGNHSSSFAIIQNGDYCNSGIKVAGYADRFKSADVVGTGLLLTKKNQLKLFFTKNGKMNGKPIALDSHGLLYPAATFLPKSQASVEANFGADPGKPFNFDLEAHRAQLFN